MRHSPNFLARLRVPRREGLVDDHRPLVDAWMDELNVLPVVKDVINLAFDSRYNGKAFPLCCDGISFLVDFETDIAGVRMRHPAGIGHDLLYRGQTMLPWFPPVGVDDFDFRQWSDEWFFHALECFDHPCWSHIQYRGLRMFGWKAYGGWTEDQMIVRNSLALGVRDPIRWRNYKPVMTFDRPKPRKINLPPLDDVI